MGCDDFLYSPFSRIKFHFSQIMQLYGLADCNNFYCSCERVFHPDLVGKPVVVLSNNDGCVIARSEEAKRLGISMGAAFYQVKEQLEQAKVAVFSSNYNLYGDMSRRVHTMLGRYTPNVDIYSIDEAFIDLSDLGDSEYITIYGKRIVREVTKGTGIPISLGVAPTKTLAKMCSKFAKHYPGYEGCCLIDSEEKREKALKLFPIEEVWGIGRRSVDKLKYHGVKTAWDLTQKTESWVQRMLTITGVRTWRELRGESCICIDELPHKQSICTSRSFPDGGLTNRADVEEALANFAARCSSKMRRENTVCKAISIFAYTNRFRPDLPTDYIYQTYYPLVPTSDLNEIVGYAVGMLRSAWKGNGKFNYKKAGVLVWNIVDSLPIQGNLFDTFDREKQAQLSRAIDEINRKNGHNAIRMAVQGYSKKWHLKCEYISKQYTTNIDDIIKLKLNK